MEFKNQATSPKVFASNGPIPTNSVALTGMSVKGTVFFS